jgi:hypothetical protein
MRQLLPRLPRRARVTPEAAVTGLIQKRTADPRFVEKVRDIVGLYLDPPDRAVVLCVDEKPQIQALDRTQPLLPLRPGQAERRTHDYKRHGTTSLFAALDVVAGHVIGRCFPRHRAQEFRRFSIPSTPVPRPTSRSRAGGSITVRSVPAATIVAHPPGATVIAVQPSPSAVERSRNVLPSMWWRP